jgi:DNA transposition AAA+ family ATPase
MQMSERPNSKFILTNEYLKFLEFCGACVENKYIGLCIGRAGVGKTSSAKYFAEWSTIEPMLGKPVRGDLLPPVLLSCCSVVYTPDVSATAKRIYSGVALLRNKFDELISKALECYRPPDFIESLTHKHMNLLIVDEAQRLSFNALETLRDIFDRSNVGLILLGMPGFERKLSRYPQLYSRVGFVHDFNTLAPPDLKLVIDNKWKERNFPATAGEGIYAAIMRVTGGNLRLVTRIFSEIERLIKLNRLTEVSPEVVNVAREGLLLGKT